MLTILSYYKDSRIEIDRQSIIRSPFTEMSKPCYGCTDTSDLEPRIAETKQRQVWTDVDQMTDVRDIISSDGTSLIKQDEDSVLRLIGPFLDAPPEEWPLESRRVDVINQLEWSPAFSSKNTEKVTLFFEASLPIYMEKYRFVEPDCLRRDEPCVHIDVIYDAIKDMTGISSHHWRDQQISNCVEVLRGRSSIDGRGASSEALEAWFEFSPQWESFLKENPKYLRMMDPYWVMIDVLGVMPHPKLADAIAAYPPQDSNLPQLMPGMNGSPYYYPFATHQAASHFAGYIGGACGLRCWVTSSSTNPPVYM
jgi:hypothetical protein